MLRLFNEKCKIVKLMTATKLIGPLRKPQVILLVLCVSVFVSTLLTLADPTPIRRFLGLESSASAKGSDNGKVPPSDQLLTMNGSNK